MCFSWVTSTVKIMIGVDLMLVIWMDNCLNQSCYHRHVWNFKKGDFEKLNRLLSEFPWDTIFILDDISSIVDAWTDTFLSLAKECIPYTSILVRPNDLP